MLLNLTKCSVKEQKVLDKNGNSEKIRSRTANQSVKEKKMKLSEAQEKVMEKGRTIA